MSTFSLQSILIRNRENKLGELKARAMRAPICGIRKPAIIDGRSFAVNTQPAVSPASLLRPEDSGPAEVSNSAILYFRDINAL